MACRRFRKARAFVSDLLTTKDGVTYAPSRVYWCLAAVTQIALSIWSTVDLPR
ncbi:hypothetical protein HMP09_1244 [Sphingomonas sp. HMP9]|nr:hypothetical protein HMP09_1244 [Sphingomonas sp. HMP9]